MDWHTPIQLKAECHMILLFDKSNTIQTNQIMMNLLNLHKVNEIENKAIEFGKLDWVGTVAWSPPILEKMLPWLNA